MHPEILAWFNARRGKWNLCQDGLVTARISDKICLCIKTKNFSLRVDQSRIGRSTAFRIAKATVASWATLPVTKWTGESGIVSLIIIFEYRMVTANRSAASTWRLGRTRSAGMVR